jgi:hypothetical protein
MNRKNKQNSDKSAKAISYAFYMMVALSRYIVPSKDLLEGYEAWLGILKEH